MLGNLTGRVILKQRGKSSTEFLVRIDLLKGEKARWLCPVHWHQATCRMGAILCRFTQQWQWIITTWSPSTCWSGPTYLYWPSHPWRNAESYPKYEEQQCIWSGLCDFCGSSPGGGEVMANFVHKSCAEVFTSYTPPDQRITNVIVLLPKKGTVASWPTIEVSPWCQSLQKFTTRNCCPE